LRSWATLFIDILRFPLNAHYSQHHTAADFPEATTPPAKL
jgi:hypothetical protein